MSLPKKLLREISWDNRSLESAADAILESPVMDYRKVDLYRKLLMSVRWHELLLLLTPAQLCEAMSDEVLQTLWPASIKKRYANAARLFSASALSTAG